MPKYLPPEIKELNKKIEYHRLSIKELKKKIKETKEKQKKEVTKEKREFSRNFILTFD